MKRIILWAPLLVFAIFVGIFSARLINPSSETVRSRLIGRPLPQFALPPARPGDLGLSTADFRDGKPRLLNVFASWCIPCAVEAPQLLALRKAGVPIVAIAIRDKPEDIARFLTRYGDPYTAIGNDVDRSVQIALGSSGVPETFVVDGRGVIRHQHIGEIRPENIGTIMAAIKAAQ